MFFRKKETEIDDDFDDDGFDDFDLDGSGFNDSTPKSGPRAAVGSIAGGFFSGIKSSFFDPTIHRKILKESLPDGYVAHYDDARDIARTTKSIYNTADKEARTLAKEYAAELKPHVAAWDEKKQSKLSKRVADLVGVGKDDTGHNVNEVSPQQMAFSNAANEIFGNQMAQQTAAGISNLTQQATVANTVGQGLQQQSNELLTTMSNNISSQSAFNEQVALKWKKKTLEIQFKQYFTARKQLDVQKQQHEYLQATLPNIVKNTSLPDVVKVQTSELAGQILAQKWIGGLTDTAHASLGGMVSKFGENIKGKISEAAQNAAGGSSMLGSALGMFNDESGFGTTPQQMILEMIGGFAASEGMNYVVGKSTDKLREHADASGVDFERHSENMKLAKHQMPAIIASMMKNGTGVGAFDKMLEWMGVDEVANARSNALQNTLENDLQSQALFDLETKKSITFTIPGLLSEIHSELSSVRMGFGFGGLESDDKLRMDWTSGQLNTRGKIKKSINNRLYGNDRRDRALNVTYDMLEDMGYDRDELVKNKQLIVDGEVLLTQSDINYLTIAIKTASYDKTKFFDIAELADGTSSLITNETASINIANFFTNHLEAGGIDENQTESIDIIGTTKRRAADMDLKKIKIQNKVQSAMQGHREDGVAEEDYKRITASGNVDLLAEIGTAALGKDGRYTFDEQADVEHLFKEIRMGNESTGELFRAKLNDIYGAQSRGTMRLNAELEAAAAKEEKKRVEAEAAKAKAEAGSTGQRGNFIERGKATVKSVNEELGKTKTEITDVAKNLADIVIPSKAQETESNETADRLSRELNPSQEELNAGINGVFNALIGIINKIKPETIAEIGGNALTAVAESAANAIDASIENEKFITSMQYDGQPFDPKRFLKATSYKDGIGSLKFRQVLADKGVQPPIPVEPYPEDYSSDEAKESRRLKRKRNNVVETSRNIKGLNTTTGPVPDNFADLPYADKEVIIASVNAGFRAGVESKHGPEAWLSGNVDSSNDSNFFFGGKVGANSGLIKNFARGGRVKMSPMQKKIIAKAIADNQNQQTNTFKPVESPNNMMSPIMSAMDKERRMGGDPQLIVASKDEQVLSTANNDAQTFRELEGSGYWDKIKDIVGQKSSSKEEDLSIKGLIKQLGVDIKQLGTDGKEKVKEGTKTLRRDIKGAAADFVEQPDDAYFESLPNSEVASLSLADFIRWTEVKMAGVEKRRQEYLPMLKQMGYKTKYTKMRFDADGKSEIIDDYQLTEEDKLARDNSAKNNLLDVNMEGIGENKLLANVKSKSLAAADKVKSLRGNANMLDDDIEGIGETFLQSRIGAVKDKLGQVDQDEIRAKLIGNLLGIKEFSTDRLSDVGNFFQGKSLPSLGSGNLSSTMIHQLAEMIRLTGHIAINTGSSVDDLTPSNPELINPFGTAGETMVGISAGKGFLASFKDRFKRQEKVEGITSNDDEDEGSRWSRFKGKFKRDKPDSELEEVMSDKEIDESTPEGKKKGLLRRMIGGMFGMSWGATKAYAKGTTAVVKGGWWATKKAAAGTWWSGKAMSKGLFGSSEDVTDVYLEGEDKPIMLARDIKKGLYYDQATGEVITKPEDIKGAVIDAQGTYVISQDDFDHKRVETRTVEGTKSLFVKGASMFGKALGGAFGVYGSVAKFSLKALWAITSAPAKFAFKGLKSDVDHASGGYIDKDVYVKGDDQPRIRAKLVGKGEYFTADQQPIETYDQLKDGVYDKEGNLILDNTDVKKGLYTPDGTPLSKLVGGLTSGASTLLDTGLKVGGVVLKAYGSIAKGAFNLVTGAGKGLWNRLRGKGGAGGGFGTNGDLMIEAQAATVDKLETIRILLDERMAIPEEKKHNDKDGDGERDGGFLDQMRKKLAARKEKADAKKKAAEDKRMEGIESNKPNMAEAIANGIGMFFSRKLLFAALGGLVAANFGPQIATGVWSGIRALLPRWAGGYSKEKKDEINRTGGTMAHMMATGKAAGAGGVGDVQTEPTVDADGNPIPESERGEPTSEEQSAGMSTGTKFALGAGAVMFGGKILRGAAKGAAKVPGLLGTGVRLASNKLGLTARMGLSGMGKWGAIKHGGKALLRGGGAVRSAVASQGLRTAAMSGLKAIPALAATPVGMFVIGAVAVAVVAYAGYKLYKHLTKKDNHLVTFRMAQYGYKMSNSKAVTKLLDLEAYLDKCAIKATTSSVSKLSKSAKAEQALKIMGIDHKDKTAVMTFFDWYYYRFKPVYLTWKTLTQRAVGKDDIGKIDEMMLMEDKLKIVEDANFNREIENPYDVMVSPFKGEEEVELNHEEVLAVRDKMVKKLSKINVEKHDAKVKAAGGGRFKSGDKHLAAITEATSSSESKLVTEASRREAAAKEEAAARQQQNRSRIASERAIEKEKKQNWLSKFMFGDKKKEAEGQQSWGDKLTNNIKGFFGVGGDGGTGGTYDASSKTLTLSDQDIKDITKVTSTEAAEHLSQAEYNRQAGAVVDTIINRVISKGYPDTVRGVINQKSQFSAISGNKGAYGSVQAMPDGAVKPKAGAFVPGYLRGRVDGTIKPVINGDLSYLNPAHSGQKALRTWGKIIMDQANKSGQIYGSKGSLHYHGTSTEMLNKKPFGFKLAIGGKTSPAQGGAGKAPVNKSVGANSNSIMGTSGIPKSGGSSNATTGTKSSSAPASFPAGKGPMKPSSGSSAAPKADLNMKSVTSKPGAGSTAEGPSFWQKAKNVHNDMSNAMSGRPSAAPVSTTEGVKNLTPEQKKTDATVITPTKPDGSPTDGTPMTASSRPAKAATIATKRSRGTKGIGYCAQYVREALQAAGYPAPGTPRGSAYMYKTNGLLAGMGFNEISASTPHQIGDVAVVSANSKSAHGHICIFNGTSWISDFTHAKPNVYGNVQHTVWYFRDKDFMNGGVGGMDGGEYGESTSNAAPAYQIKFDAQLEKLKARQAKRDEITKKAKNTIEIKETIGGFKNTRGKSDAKSVADKISAKNGFDSSAPKVTFKLGKTEISPVDMTPSGYEPAVREDTIERIEDNGAVGNSTGGKRDSEELRLETLATEERLLGEATNAQAIRDKIEQQNQEQIQRLEKKHQEEVASATDYKVVQEKQQKLAESDSSISQKQLEVQVSMAKDIRRMADAMDKQYMMPPSGTSENKALDPSSETRTIKPATQHRQMQTVATMEPVSMKIN